MVQLRRSSATRGQLVRAELGEAVEHARRAAEYAAGGTGAATRPRMTVRRRAGGAGWLGMAAMRRAGGMAAMRRAPGGMAAMRRAPGGMAGMRGARPEPARMEPAREPARREPAPRERGEQAATRVRRLPRRSSGAGRGRRRPRMLLVAGGVLAGMVVAGMVRRRKERWGGYDPDEVLESAAAAAQREPAGAGDLGEPTTRPGTPGTTAPPPAAGGPTGSTGSGTTSGAGARPGGSAGTTPSPDRPAGWAGPSGAA